MFNHFPDGMSLRLIDEYYDGQIRPFGNDPPEIPHYLLGW
jgi:hypothetical protein